MDPVSTPAIIVTVIVFLIGGIGPLAIALVLNRRDKLQAAKTANGLTQLGP